LSDLASNTLLKFGFEPMISLTLLTPRAVYAVLSITYDREVSGEDQRALACYVELARRCGAAGFYPYRLGIQSEPDLGRAKSYETFMTALKEAVDPQSVLAPGRYEPHRVE
jgi:4-cresol dehydrogenase (hydroxylating)